jgi:hypothetical protein
MATTKFQAGRIYWSRFFSNYDRVVRFEIVRRTEKTAIIRNLNTGKEGRKKIHQHTAGWETIHPMAGIVLSPDRIEYNVDGEDAARRLASLDDSRMEEIVSDIRFLDGPENMDEENEIIAEWYADEIEKWKGETGNV